jgi:hypothetical protein
VLNDCGICSGIQRRFVVAVVGTWLSPVLADGAFEATALLCGAGLTAVIGAVAGRGAAEGVDLVIDNPVVALTSLAVGVGFSVDNAGMTKSCWHLVHLVRLPAACTATLYFV